MFTRKELIKIAYPLLIEQTLVLLVGLVDTMMVSSAGEAAVSGVSLVHAINVLLTSMLSAFASGGSVLCSQNLGRNDLEGAGYYAKQLLLANLGIALILAAAFIGFNRQILSLLYGSIAPDVMTNARIYFYITAASIPFFAIYNSMAATFRAEGNSRVSMNVALLVNAVNVSGNAIGIFVFHAGVVGVAVPTLLSRIVGALVICCIMARTHDRIQIRFFEKLHFDFKAIREIFSIGLPMGIENGLFQFGKLILATLVATLGTSSVAAFAVANSICNFCYLPGTGISLCVPGVIGQCMGAGEYRQAKQNALRLIGIAYSILLPLNAILFVFAPWIVGVFQVSPQATQIAIYLVRLNSVFIIIHPFAFMIVHVFRAASDVRLPMIMSVSSMWICRIGFAYLFVRGFHFGLEGVWYAMFMDWIVRVSVYAPRFFSGRWQKEYIEMHKAPAKIPAEGVKR